MSVITRLRDRLHRRKRNRERKRRLHQGHRARREARAVRKLRRLIRLALAPRRMYDAVTVGNIPPRARAVAGYVDGNYETMPSLRQRFPTARKVSIAVSSSALADCLDVEPGDATNADAARWFRRFKEKRPHDKPIFYTSAGNVAELIAHLGAAGIHRHEYVIWAAHYTNQRHVCSPKACGYPSAEATQWTTHGETVDESKLTARFWQR